MIKKVQIKNFQSHESTELDLVPGINVILGRSQAGKTAMLRGLLWLVTNRPGGLRFRSHFAKKSLPTEVRVVLSMKSKNREQQLALSKSPSNKATYSVGKSSFQGFGQGVPKEVQEALNINPDINIHQQLDAPFLITATPSEAARVINKATRLENVGKWLSQLTKLGRSANKEMSLVGDDIKDIKDELSCFDDLDDLEKDVEELGALERDVDSLESAIDLVGELIDDLEQWDERIMVSKQILHSGKDVDEAFELIGLIRKTEKDMLFVEQLIGDVKTAEHSFEDAQTVYNTQSKALVEFLTKLKRCPLCFNEIDDVEEVLKRL